MAKKKLESKELPEVPKIDLPILPEAKLEVAYGIYGPDGRLIFPTISNLLELSWNRAERQCNGVKKAMLIRHGFYYGLIKIEPISPETVTEEELVEVSRLLEEELLREI